MATGRHHNPPGEEEPTPGATEPITLTDPDGAVTLVAPWSTWTREQVRAPGGEPALVTRLEQGQLWFSAGRRRSPWRHEVRIGAVSVSAPEGRFHVTAEPDGGATVDCLAGRTRVAAGLQEPVVLGPQQTAAVASDGGTLVVLDNGDGRATVATVGPTAADPLAPSSAHVADEPPSTDPSVAPVAAAAGAGAAVGAAASGLGDDAASTGGGDAHPGEGGGGSDDGGEVPRVAGDEPRRRPSRLPELVSVAALLAVLVAGIVVFGRHTDNTDTGEVAAPPASSTTVASTTTAAPTTTEKPTTTTTAAPRTTTTVASTTPPNLSNPAIARGALASCKRSDGGVVATINVSLTSGGPGRFKVGVGLVGANGDVFAKGEAKTAMIDQGGSIPVDVLVAVPGEVKGACELLGVEAA